ncbi:hypothetical protein BBP40_005856 [Aspergillus hancockii]|nr:hypothetical protein BBP40_005856 [Aspergillus hancockii]
MSSSNIFLRSSAPAGVYKPPPCMAYDPNVRSPFGYEPSLIAGIVFSALFAVIFVWHVAQTFWHRNLFLGITFSLGAFGELGGWVGRAIANKCPYSVPLLEEQLVLLILAPTFTTAGIYCVLSMMVPIVGRDKSPLSPRTYLIIFIGADVLSLILQGIGGGMSASALGKDGNEWPGTYTMVAGIIFQLVVLVIFTVFFQWVMFRAMRQVMNDPPLRNIYIAVNLSILFLVIRGIFRSVELLQGWRGYLFTHEIYTIVLDAVMVLLSLLIFNIFNPGLLLKKAKKNPSPASLELESGTEDRESK